MSFLKLFSNRQLLYNVARSRIPYRRQTNVAPDKDEKEEAPFEKCAVMGFYEVDKAYELSEEHRKIDNETKGKLCEWLTKLSCELKLGKSFVVTDIEAKVGDVDVNTVALTNLGPKNANRENPLESLDELRENTRLGLSAGLAQMQGRPCNPLKVIVDKTHCPRDVVPEITTLFNGNYELSAEDKKRKKNLAFLGELRAKAQNFARQILITPTNEMTPADFAQTAMNELCKLGIKVTAHDEEWILANRMEAFAAVAKGSCESPIFLELEYNGAAHDKPSVLIAAKGVTFDSGGLCLKTEEGLHKRDSLAGAAATMAAIRSVAAYEAKINIRAVIPLCENMLSGQCIKVGDVVRALNGTSIQVEDTDMEGQLILSDALVYGQAKYRPSLVIDVSTLIDGLPYGFGAGAFACFSNSNNKYDLVRRAGVVTGDRPWRLPLWRYFDRQLTNLSAVDLRNKGSGKGAVCLGAAFLKNFVCGDWIHMDITGLNNYTHGASPLYLKDDVPTGRPARTLVQTLIMLAEEDKDNKVKQ